MAPQQAAPPPSTALLSPDLRKRIEIMAEHIARNGHDFERTVRQKNANNPQFAFLYNGEGAEYYHHVLAGFRGSGHAAAAVGPGMQQVVSGGGVGGEFAELLRRWKEPPVFPLAADVEKQLTEVVASLEAMASRDAIRGGRAWIECNSAVAQQIAGNIMKRLAYLQSCAHRLHVLYLVHDVLQTEAARKDGPRPLIKAFKPFLPWMLRPAYQLASKANPNGDELGRVLRLIQLWVERDILDAKEAEDIKALVTTAELPGVPPSHPLGPTTRPGAAPVVQAVAPSMQAAQVRPTAAPMGHPGVPPYVRHPGMPGATLGGMPYGAAMVAGIRPQIGGCGGCGLIPGQMPGMGAMPTPRLQGYRPLLPHMMGKQTPETVPVGVLATMMMHAVRRVGRANFVPYGPMDTSQTPQMLPPMEVPTQRLLERVEDFYLDLKDEERGSSSSRSSSSRSRSRSCSSRSRSRSRSRDPARELAAKAAAGGFMMPGAGSMGAVPPPAAD